MLGLFSPCDLQRNQSFRSWGGVCPVQNEKARVNATMWRMCQILPPHFQSMYLSYFISLSYDVILTPSRCTESKADVNFGFQFRNLYFPFTFKEKLYKRTLSTFNLILKRQQPFVFFYACTPRMIAKLIHPQLDRLQMRCRAANYGSHIPSFLAVEKARSCSSRLL